MKESTKVFHTIHTQVKKPHNCISMYTFFKKNINPQIYGFEYM